MSTSIPNRCDVPVNETALAQVRADKVRESNDGFDGTWVAHPDLVETAREAFAQKMGDKRHQRTDARRSEWDSGSNDRISRAR